MFKIHPESQTRCMRRRNILRLYQQNSSVAFFFQIGITFTTPYSLFPTFQVRRWGNWFEVSLEFPVCLKPG